MLDLWSRLAREQAFQLSALVLSTTLAISGTVLASEQQVIPASLDLLKMPAPKTLDGTRKLLLSVGRAGKHLISVGQTGLALTSANKGRHWTQVPMPTAVMLTAVEFVNEKKGWAVGHDGVILVSNNGGLSWKRQFDGSQANAQILRASQAQLAAAGDIKDEVKRQMLEDRFADAEAASVEGASRPMMDVHFLDEHHGFVVGSFGQLFETFNGGEHWEFIGQRLKNPEGLHFNSLHASSQGVLFIAAEGGVVFRSADQGRSWQRTETGYKGNLYGVVTPGGGGVVMAYGFNGHLFRSIDGGGQWKEIKSVQGKSIVHGVALDAERILLASQDGHLLWSEDAGLSFKLLKQRLNQRRLSHFDLSPDGQLVAVGLGGITTQQLNTATE